MMAIFIKKTGTSTQEAVCWKQQSRTNLVWHVLLVRQKFLFYCVTLYFKLQVSRENYFYISGSSCDI